MATYMRVTSTTDLQPGQAKMVMAGDRRIAVFNVDGNLLAIDDTCTHRGGPLSEGQCVNRVVTCPWHGAQFNLESGEVLAPPAPQRVSTYPVRVTDGFVEVEV